jgi:hypothetical protein
MQIELTDEQQDLLQAENSGPLRVLNPRTKETFFLVPAGVYERLTSLLHDEYDPREAYPNVDRVMAEDDANDPYLECYQGLRRENRP